MGMRLAVLPRLLRSTAGDAQIPAERPMILHGEPQGFTDLLLSMEFPVALEGFAATEDSSISYGQESSPSLTRSG